MSQEKDEKESMPHPLTKEELELEIKGRVDRIGKEFSEAFNFLASYPKSVSFFGSSRCTEESEHYQQARDIAYKIVKELGYAVVTGGSNGIMEAANRGAFEAGGESLGLNIKLPKEQNLNKYTTAEMSFKFFFVRKVALSFAAEAYIFFPGGFGTLDELFEIITLVQTHKIRHVPIFLVGKDYWEPLDDFIRENVFELHRAISKTDMLLYRIVEDAEEIIADIRMVPVHDGRLHRHSALSPTDS